MLPDLALGFVLGCAGYAAGYSVVWAGRKCVYWLRVRALWKVLQAAHDDGFQAGRVVRLSGELAFVIPAPCCEWRPEWPIRRRVAAEAQLEGHMFGRGFMRGMASVDLERVEHAIGSEVAAGLDDLEQYANRGDA
jgi:hypothetical protein